MNTNAKRILASLLAGVLAVGSVAVYGSAASPEVENLDGGRTAFVSSFGKMSYGGKSHVSYKTFDEAYNAIGKDGGKIVISGSSSWSADDSASRGALTVEGIGSKPTGNVIELKNEKVTLGGDLSITNAAFRPTDGGLFCTAGHSLTTGATFDTYYTIPDYTTGAHNYPTVLNVVSGTASAPYTFDIAGGTYGTFALSGGGDVTADVKAVFAGGNYDTLYLGAYNGSMTGNTTVTISDGSYEKVVVGASDGTLGGNVDLVITGGIINELAIGSFGAGAAANGNVSITIKGGKIASFTGTGDGAKTGNMSCFVLDGGATNAAVIKFDARKPDSFVSISGGSSQFVYDDAGKLTGLRFFDNNGFPADAITNNGKEVAGVNGVFALTTGENVVKIIPTFKVGFNENASFVAGYEDGTFAPQKTMTKAEAVTLLTRVIADESAVKNGNFPSSFADVAAGAWYTPYIGFFEKAGLLDKLSKDGAFKPQDAITRGEFVQLIYNIGQKYPADATYREFAKLIYNVSANMTVAEKYSAFTDVDYNNYYDRAIYYAVANGYVTGYEDGSFAPANTITRAEVVTIVNRVLGRIPTGNGSKSFSDIDANWAKAQILAACNVGEGYTFSGDVSATADGRTLPQFVKDINTLKKATALQDVIGTHVFKVALAAMDAPDMPGDTKASLRMIIEDLRAGRVKGNARNVAGTPDDPLHYIYSYMGNVMIRDVTVESNKPNSEPVEITVFNDAHFNTVNDKDMEEKNPSIMSTIQGRTWLKGGSSKNASVKAMKYGRFSDQVIVNGDILDYLSWGAKEMTTDVLFRMDTDIMATLGGHDVTRVMQGTVADPTSYESRTEILQEFWPHDIYYTSKVIQDKVMLICMDNGSSRYWDWQVAPLKADIELAREKGYVVLVFGHEPICTKNPDEVKAAPIRRNDTADYDFCNSCIGRTGTGGATLEVYDLITKNADVVRGFVAAHFHSDYVLDIMGSYTDENGNVVEKTIPQYINTAVVYDNESHILRITVK